MEDEHGAAEATLSPEELAQHAASYRADALRRQSQATKKLDEELRRLEKLEKQYRRPLERALEREGGPDAEAMKRGLKELIEEEDPEARDRKAKELRRRHGGLMKRAMDASGIDRKDARRKLLAAIGHPEISPREAWALDADAAALAADVELIETDSLGFSLLMPPKPPPPPPPPPGPQIVTFSPPYPFRWVSSEELGGADVDTGKMWATSLTQFGPVQTVASVGATLRVGPQVGRVRVEARPDLEFKTQAGCGFGYASSEAKVNLIVRDGLREVLSDRQSLDRSIAVVAWWSETPTTRGEFPLACEFNHAVGTSSTYSVIVELESVTTAAGFPGAVAWAKNGVVAPLGGFQAVLYS